jgi:hypothetical protein
MEMATEQIEVKIEELEPGMVLPGGAVVKGVTEHRPLRIEWGDPLKKWIRVEDARSFFGPTVTVTREVKMEPFESTVGAVATDDYHNETIAIWLHAPWPKGTKCKVYPQGTEPTRLVPDEVREAAQWVKQMCPPRMYPRACVAANWILSQEKPKLPGWARAWMEGRPGGAWMDGLPGGRTGILKDDVQALYDGLKTIFDVEGK